MTRHLVLPRVLPLAFLSAALAGAAAWLMAVWWTQRPPSLADLPALLAAGRFDEVEARLAAFLKVRPRSAQANMLMAQAALARPDQKPALALEHLRKVQSTSASANAVVRLNEGKAYAALGRNNLAEGCWREALRLDPLVPEAGWNLLGLYQVYGRKDDAHQLAMSLLEREPDPRDRAQLLLELLRQDAQPISADSLIQTLEPLLKEHPDDLHAAIALGRAYVRNSRFDEGLSVVRELAARHPDNPYVWEAVLFGLDESSRIGELAEALASLPAPFAEDERLDRYRGTLALARREWKRAASLYRNAARHDPSDYHVLYRLCLALRMAGGGAELAEQDARLAAMRGAREQTSPLYKEANATPNLGIAPHPDLYHRLADLRERIGRKDECLAWHRMVLADEPDDRVSRAAVDRLAARAE